jgi:predicted permease
VDPLAALRTGGRGHTSTAARRLESWLLAVQIAVALTLLVGTGLFLRSLARLQSVEPGFSTDNVLTMRLSLPRRTYDDPVRLARFMQDLRSKLASIPGVESAAEVSILPLSGARFTTNFTVDGQPAPGAEEAPVGHYRLVTPEYFAVMRIPILEGRPFDSHDAAAAPFVVIINQTLARRFWPQGNALGGQLSIDNGTLRHGITIVGIAGDAKHLGLDLPPDNDLYVPVDQISAIDVPGLTNSSYWVVRTAVDPMSIATAVRRQVQSIDQDVAASNIRTMNQVVGNAVDPRRFSLRLLQVFSLAALLLAVSGVYAVASQAAARRKREISIRLALGASPGRVAWLVASENIQPIAVGLSLGLTGALLLGRLIRGLLFEVGIVDPGTLAAATMALFVGAALASSLPATRAARLSPQLALNDD